MTTNINQEYSDFTGNIKKEEIIVSGVEWNYYTLGQGTESFLILTGGGSIPEASFQYANALSKNYKVIIPALPEVYTMADCVEGVNQILIQENISATNFLGFSMGGMISQCFVRKYPDKVKNLIFFVSMLPSKAYAKKYTKYKKGISIVPKGVFKWISKRSITKQIMQDADNSNPEIIKFWIDFFTWEFDSEEMNKNLLLANTDVLIDYFSNYSFTESDLNSWQGNILIIESDKDATIVKQERDRFKEVYSNAKLITQRNSGHFGDALLNPENLINEIYNFINPNAKSSEI